MSKSKSVRRLGGAVIVSSALLATLAGTQANGAMIGVKFFTGRGGALASPVTGTAGVVPIGNWNNVASAVATTALNDSTGSPSGASLALTGSTGSWSSGTVADGANGSLMDGYIDDGNGATTTATISGLTSGTAYDVYVYAQSDAQRPGNAGDGRPNYTVNGTQLYTLLQAPVTTATGGVSDETLSQGSIFNTQATVVGVGPNKFAYPEDPSAVYGNYVKFASVTATGGVITVTAGTDTSSFRSPLDGIELVPAAVPEPTSIGLLGVGALAVMKRRRRTV